MNKVQYLEHLFHKYPTSITLDLKFFCQQTMIWISFARVFSRWNMNKVQQNYTSFQKKTLAQIKYENWVLGKELITYLGEKKDVPYYIQVVQQKHYNDVYRDLQAFEAAKD